MTSPSRRFLFATWEGGGTILPFVAAAQKLAARGHDVRIMSERCNRQQIEDSRIRFSEWRRALNRAEKSPETDPLRDWEVPPGPERFGRAIERIMTGRSLAYAEDIIDELQRNPADLVISSEFLLGVLAGCESMGQPVAILTCGICLYPYPGSPPFGGGMLPPTNRSEQLALEQLRLGVGQMLDSGLPDLNEARRSLGLQALDHTMDQIRSAGAPLLLGTSQAFDFAWEELPADVRYVGPQIADPANAFWNSPWATNDPRPLVLVAFSTTFQDHAAVVQRVIDAGRDLPIRLLVTTGPALDPEELRGAPNCSIVRTAPHVQVMKEAAAVVTHGGHGTVIRAIAAGLPMLLIPHGRDQDDNAARIVARGAGLNVLSEATTAEIRAALHRLLNDQSYNQAASALGSRVAEETEASKIVEELEKLAKPAATQKQIDALPAPVGLAL